MSIRPSASFARATLEYDREHERTLFDVITHAIVADSKVSDCNAVVIRTGEAAQALVTALSTVLALSQAATRSPTAIRKIANAIGKCLHQQSPGQSAMQTCRILFAGRFAAATWRATHEANPPAAPDRGDLRSGVSKPAGHDRCRIFSRRVARRDVHQHRQERRGSHPHRARRRSGDLVSPSARRPHEAIRHAITRNSDGSPASILGTVVDALAVLSGEERS
jgi:hypothetical protein